MRSIATCWRQQATLVVAIPTGQKDTHTGHFAAGILILIGNWAAIDHFKMVAQSRIFFQQQVATRLAQEENQSIGSVPAAPRMQSG